MSLPPEYPLLSINESLGSDATADEPAKFHDR
jgi:hypothetical protein